MGETMAPYITWFLLALVFLALEMISGTFYMLVLSVALAVGGIAALLGLVLPLQLTFAALAGIAGTLLLRRFKNRGSATSPEQSLDIGLPVQVLTWHESGSARVLFRGAEWDAEPLTAETPHQETLYIAALRGSTLILTHINPHQPG